MVFLGIMFKTRLKYSKELFDYNVKNTKTSIINNKSYNESWYIKIIFPIHTYIHTYIHTLFVM